MGLMVTLLVGLVVGVLARFFMPGRDAGGFAFTILLGIAGALLAGFVGRAAGWFRSPTELSGIVASVIGAMLLLGLYRVVFRPTARPLR